MAGKIYKTGMSLLVIDTENKFVSTGFAKEIARVAQGLSPTRLLVLFHVILPNATICNKFSELLVAQGSTIIYQMLQML